MHLTTMHLTTPHHMHCGVVRCIDSTLALAQVTVPLALALAQVTVP